MDSAGKIIWAKNNEIYTSNIKTTLEKEVTDGERVIILTKDLGQCEIYPTKLKHSPNGRYQNDCNII